MFAIAAAIVFVIALIADLAHLDLGVSSATLVTAGLLGLALHLAGLGSNVRTRGWGARLRR